MDISSEKIRPTVEWMREKYDELNSWLFGGQLGGCNFNIFTTGKGSQGGTLGWFKLTGKDIYVNRYSRRLYLDGFKKQETDNGFLLMPVKTNITHENFVELCRPTIELNGHYTATEEAWLGTLAHEMCHYYTYMNGICPKQGHGPEFRSIGEAISSRSDGLFTIQRLASAEQMTNFELDDEMKTKKETRINNKKSRMIVLLIFTKVGRVELTLSTNEKLIHDIITFNLSDRNNRLSKSVIRKVITSNDANLVEYFFSRGYRKSLRTYRFWGFDTDKLGGEDFVENGGYDYNLVYSDNGLNSNDKSEDNVESDDVKPEPKKRYVFSIKTSNGQTEIEYDGTQEDLRDKLVERFPKMSEVGIERIMSNKANYRVMENRGKKKIDVDMIVEKVLNDIVNKDDRIKLNPDMNLGLESPLEEEI